MLTGRVAGRDVAVVLRYGVGLTIPSHKINYGANVWALRALGVQRVISQSAIGSVNPAIRPGDIVISHDFLDRTRTRQHSLHDDSACWVRVDMTEPFCPETPAEVRAFQRDGGDIVGTPLVPEVVFARKAESCFASIAPVINFGAGMAPAVVHFGPGSMNETYYADGLHDLIERISANAVAAIAAVRHCGCGQALRGGFHGQRPGWLTKCSLDEAGAGPGADA